MRFLQQITRNKKKNKKKMFMNNKNYKKYGDTCEDTKAQQGASKERSQEPITS